VAAQVGAGLALRTERRSLRTVGLLSNRFLLAAIAVEAALSLALVEVPPLQGLFHTAPLAWEHWALLAVWPPLVVGAEEARKAVARARARGAGIAQARSGRPPMPAGPRRGTLGT
jgi:magnesium-transporting ATPase (P-type)